MQYLKELIFVLFCLISSISSNCQSITIERKFESKECTMGYLYVNDSLICYSLERADLANSKNASRIPLGSYQAYIRTDSSKGWRVELIDVPHRTNIQIHIGNYPFQTTGCTLIGTSATPGNCTVQNSAVAINKLKFAMKKLSDALDLDKNSSQQYSITVIYK